MPLVKPGFIITKLLRCSLPYGSKAEAAIMAIALWLCLVAVMGCRPVIYFPICNPAPTEMLGTSIRMSSHFLAASNPISPLMNDL